MSYFVRKRAQCQFRPLTGPCMHDSLRTGATIVKENSAIFDYLKFQHVL